MVIYWFRLISHKISKKVKNMPKGTIWKSNESLKLVSKMTHHFIHGHPSRKQTMACSLNPDCAYLFIMDVLLLNTCGYRLTFHHVTWVALELDHVPHIVRGHSDHFAVGRPSDKRQVWSLTQFASYQLSLVCFRTLNQGCPYFRLFL